MKVTYAYSVILATLSFIATETIEKYGLRSYYNHLAQEFKRESGYFDLQHPDALDVNSIQLSFSQWVRMDSTHWLYKPSCCLKGLVLRDIKSDSLENILPLSRNQDLNNFLSIDSVLYLVDSKMDVYKSFYPFDSISTSLVSDNHPEWNSTAFCYHKPTKRFIFCSTGGELDSRTRYLYDYSLVQNKYSSEPIFQFDADAVIEFLGKGRPKIYNNFVSKKEAWPNLVPNAMAVHPKTNDFYLLCCEDRILIVFSQFGQIQDVSYLDEKNYANPISISFLENGDLIVANQGVIESKFNRISWNKLWQTMRGAREFSFVH